MTDIRARVQVGENHHMFPMEVAQPHREIGDAMVIAQKLGGAALEVVDAELVQSKRWADTLTAEGLPTLFDV
jgi:hypothetical protein